MYHVVGRKVEWLGGKVKVITKGTRRWLFGKMVKGVRPDILIGHYPKVTLAQAHVIAESMCDLLKADKDPG